MGITRDSIHKRRATSGKQKEWRKKRKYEIGRPAAMTHLGGVRVHPVRCRGGIIKHRALRLETGNFSWGSEVTTRKCRILNVVYNASNNELVRMKVLVKGCIVEIDASPFAAWYEKHYGVSIGKKKISKAQKDKKGGKEKAAEKETVKKMSDHLHRKMQLRNKHRSLSEALAAQFQSGRLLARISSRPGQCGRADGYILEGPELEFYSKKVGKKKGNK
ncbi:putative 40S ribosomal protein S8-1 [Monocercomonoides exilis]|uniref:putative 40S ribosomal protein S8-1 n=1 Tax=Monocercomonoides exilis TaxID=2049356 RepID=UPI00355A8C7C|nr:putative 40S ribosomal protein S8-1 [Monocercomonoides exilis]KAH7830353.1 putative 40S ribosomal protein S8-1 [Monocercomonoides exilis]KAH7832570.1 putative 40S ribosomal protein S8-1 [Monocercomonoides exilis]|eukprot:MONOS_3180.1-p1 / transcript=MONOS_3180.1 / gene=MONOS_3180 / organism=Monocercomonoides_exilis_PA203 / gene_product=40S ribosomal protein S8-1 / transcript_product=40S ribosomal protein S8-1 / location=Mono_scaffold00072:138087-138954(-) / protein_length=218 / sequence_SO=supercontig / SO=protein_coding / is_pseudo=false